MEICEGSLGVARACVRKAVIICLCLSTSLAWPGRTESRVWPCKTTLQYQVAYAPISGVPVSNTGGLGTRLWCALSTTPEPWWEIGGELTYPNGASPHT